MRDVLPFVNTAALVVVAGGLVYVGAQVTATSKRLEQLAQLESASPTAALSATGIDAHARPPSHRRDDVITGSSASGAPVEAAIDEHLWSEEGRAVIEDVVESRRQEERQRHGERWRQMADPAPPEPPSRSRRPST